MSLAPDEIRAIVEQLPPDERCDPKCPGWGVFQSNRIEGCDSCTRARKSAGIAPIGDAAFESLPEAQEALTEEAVDPWRCASARCGANHPVAGAEAVEVTCPRCRDVLALPPLASEPAAPLRTYRVVCTGMVSVGCELEVEADSPEAALAEAKRMLEEGIEDEYGDPEEVTWYDVNNLAAPSPDDLGDVQMDVMEDK